MHRPWLVASGGRTGSSTMARILHESMGISMGHEFPPPDEHNPKGYYEDTEFYALDDAMWGRNQMTAYHYGGLLAGRIKHRGAEGVAWGVKNPWLRMSIGHYIYYIHEQLQVDPIMVVTRRSLYKQAQSLMKMKSDWAAHGYKTSFEILALRNAVFNEHMSHYPTIKVHEFHIPDHGRVPDTDVLEWLQEVQVGEKV